MNEYPFTFEPMGIGTILDRSFKIYGKRFGSFAVFSLLIYGVLMAIGFISQMFFIFTASRRFIEFGLSPDFFQNSYYNYYDFSNLFAPFRELAQQFSFMIWVTLILMFCSLFIIPLVLGGISYIATGCFLGEKSTLKECFSFIVNKYWSLFSTYICSGIVLIGLIFSIIIVIAVLCCAIFGMFANYVAAGAGILLMMALFAVYFIAVFFINGVNAMVFPIAVRENLSGFAPIDRAFKVGFKKFWKTVGTCLMTTLITTVPVSIVFSILIGIAAATRSTGVILLSLFIFVFAVLLLFPVMLIAMSLNYYSVRIQKEGYKPEPAVKTIPGPAEYAKSEPASVVGPAPVEAIVSEPAVETAIHEPAEAAAPEPAEAAHPEPNETSKPEPGQETQDSDSQTPEQ